LQRIFRLHLIVSDQNIIKDIAVELMAYLQRLLRRAAEHVGRSYEELLPIEKLLEENWFDSAEAVRHITDRDFEVMRVPKRLAVVLKQLAAQRSPNMQQGSE